MLTNSEDRYIKTDREYVFLIGKEGANVTDSGGTRYTR